MLKTTPYLPKMDCPEEIKLIKSGLQSRLGIEELTFNLLQKELTVTHTLSDTAEVQNILNSLGMESHVKVEGDEKGCLTFPEAVAKKIGLLLDYQAS